MDFNANDMKSYFGNRSRAISVFIAFRRYNLGYDKMIQTVENGNYVLRSTVHFNPDEIIDYFTSKKRNFHNSFTLRAWNEYLIMANYFKEKYNGKNN